LLKTFDLICLSNAVVTSFMLIRTFGTGADSGMSWHYQLPMILYAMMNVTQLGLLLLKPDLHQAYRFQVGVTPLRDLGCVGCGPGTATAVEWDPGGRRGSLACRTHTPLLPSLTPADRHGRRHSFNYS
jgi:hypothetical protein